MTPRELKVARKAMGLTQSELAGLLRLSEKNGDRSIRVWETEGNTVPGPIQVVMEYLLKDAAQKANGKTAKENGKPDAQQIEKAPQNEQRC